MDADEAAWESADAEGFVKEAKEAVVAFEKLHDNVDKGWENIDSRLLGQVRFSRTWCRSSQVHPGPRPHRDRSIQDRRRQLHRQCHRPRYPVWSQYYMRSSRYIALSWYCNGVECSEHVLIPCRFVVPPEVARRCSLHCLRGISVIKNQRCISFLSQLGLKLFRRMVVRNAFSRKNTIGYRARKRISSLMTHKRHTTTSTFGTNFSKTIRLTMTNSLSRLRATAVQVLTLP